MDGEHGTSGTSGTDMSIALIEEQADASIRRIWHDGRMFFSVIDVIGLLTDAPTPRTYWAMMKERIQSEGFRELLTKCERLKMAAADGKQRQTDAADTETLLRIIQSVPSPKAEPVKQWLARVGARRLDEVARPLDAADVSHAITATPKPSLDAPALAWAEYHEQLAALYRRQAAYEIRLAYVDATVSGLSVRLDDHEEQIGELHGRLEGMEEVTRLVPEILQRLGPQPLTSEHQATIKHQAARLHELSGLAYATIYGDLNAAFHVARYSDIPDARWPEIAAWLTARIEAAAKRSGQR
jgi:BRO family protein